MSQISGEDNTSPPPLARFITELRPAPGNLAYALELWQPGHKHSIRSFSTWTLAIPALAHKQLLDLPERATAVAEPEPILDLLHEDWVHEAAYPELDLDFETAHDSEQPLEPAPVIEFESVPPVCSTVAVVPPPEAAERWRVASMAATLASEAVPVAPILEGLLAAVLHAPQSSGAFLPAPAAEPVAAWVESVAAATPVSFGRGLRLPVLATEAISAVPALGDCLPVPSAEPVTAWLASAASAEPVAFQRALQLPAAAATTATIAPESAGYLPVPAAEPVASWLSIVACAVPVAFPRTLELPAAMELIRTPENSLTAEQPESESSFAEIAAGPVSAFPAVATATPIAFASDLHLPVALDLSCTAGLAAEPAIAGAASVPASVPALAASSAPIALAAAVQLPAPLGVAGAAKLSLATGSASEAAPADVTTMAASILPIAAASALQLPAALDALAPVEMPLAAGSDSEAALADSGSVPYYAVMSNPTAAAPALPAFGLSADLDELDEALEPPPLCERWMAAPQAEPVWSFLQFSSAGALLTTIPAARPVLAANVTPTHVPLCTTMRPGLQAEPVMAGVWPRIAEIPVESIAAPAPYKLPQVAAAVAIQGLVAAASVPSVAPEAVETLLTPSCAGAVCVPISLQLPTISAVAAAIGEPSLALPAAGLQAEPAATWIEAASADSVSVSQPVTLQPFQVEGDSTTAVPIPEAPAFAARAAEPAPATHRVIELRPVATMRVALPQQGPQRPTTQVPSPGVVALEYHMQRTRSECYARPEWKSVSYQPQAPVFAMRAILENLEDLIKPKAPLAGVFPINNRRKLVNRSKIMEHVLRVAAAVLIVTSIWGGAAALKNARRVTVRPPEETAFATPNRVLTPETQTVVTSKAAQGKGPVNWFRQTVANRASLQVGEDFQGGMQRWTSAGGGTPANWRRSADGYAVTGALAIFGPTAKFDDYKLEFFGQIESKSIGWVVRAKDAKNYHAMKFTTIERGLRPIIAMVHYSVVDGKAGRRTQTPLNVMVHNNRPFQVAVTVRGKHFVTEVDGEEVDRFREDGLPVGGVGFFSDAGETARLYWARVTKNDDWLGHVCAFLSGGESQATASLRRPAFPGGAPAPWNPTGDPAVLTAAWIGLPSLRRNQSPQRQKRCNR